MSTYIAVVFANQDSANKGLKALWGMDDDAQLTVHGAAIARRDRWGYVDVSSKHTDLGLRTAYGVGLGALLGILASPIGVAVGVAGAATLAFGTAVGVGATAGGMVGMAADAVKSVDRSELEQEMPFVLEPGQYAVIAEVSETENSKLNATMQALGGSLHRIPTDAIWVSRYGIGATPNYRGSYYNNYLYPYYSEPSFY